MADVRVRAMTEPEYAAFLEESVRSYAEAKVRAGQWRPEDAPALAERSYDELLPDGPRTADMLLCVGELPDGTVVGSVWIALVGPSRPDEAFIYDIAVAAEQRGRGYGRALLAAAEREVARRGIAAIGLNVFGYNTVARSLYESAGWETQAVQMRKSLTP